MRSMIVPFLLLSGSTQIQRPPLNLVPALAVSTTRPRVDVGTAFKLSGTAVAGVTWDFGDDTAPQPGGSTITHVYRSAGTFTVKATVNGKTAQQSVTVVEPRRVVATPVNPAPGKAVSLKLEEAFGTTVQWNFGDGAAPMSGRPSIAHTFLKEGSYTVIAKDSGTEVPREFKLVLPVGTQGPGAPFSISYLALRWEDGATERSVRQGEADLVAFADLKFEGTGQLQAEWVVDGQVQRAVSQQLGFAKLTTLQSGQTLATPLSTRVVPTSREGRHVLASTVPGEFKIALPTNVAGEHQVSLKVLQPRLTFQVPVIRYFVKLAGETQGPVVQSLSPANAKPGEEVELILTGTGFRQDMTLNLGKDVAVLGPPQILSPEKAVVKVFIAPTAQPGSRLFQARKPGGSPAGMAHLEIVPALRSGALAKVPGAIQAPMAPTTAPTQPMQGSLPGGKPAVGLKSLVEAPKPAGALGLTKADDKAKKPPIALIPALPRAQAVDLVKVPKAVPGFSRIVGTGGGKGLAHIVDSKAAARKEKVLACTEGQKLKLSKITLGAPSFSLIGVNTSGEFQSDYLPVLRDSTQFTWKEKNPGTSEYFELRLYAAKNGSLLKSIRIPGNRSSYDVTPAFVQELGHLFSQNALSGMKGLNSNLLGGTAPATMGKTPKASQPGASPSAAASTSGPLSHAKLKAGTALQAQTGKGTPAATPTVNLGSATGALQVMESDPNIPAPMRQKADVVWQLVGFRSYPCLPPEDLAAQSKVPELHLTPGAKPLPLLNQPIPQRLVPQPSKPAIPTPNARLGTAKTPSVRAGSLAPKAEGSGGLSATGSTPILDRSISAQGQAPARVSEVPKVYQTVAAEVSRSEVWALRMPVTPQGVNAKTCTISQNDKKVTLEPNKKANDGSKPGWGIAPTYSVVSQKAKVGGKTNPQPKTVLDENTYTFDEVFLHGTFDLGQKVPYRLIPGSVNNPAAEAVAQAVAAANSAINSAAGAMSGFGSGGGKSAGSASGNPIIATAVNQVSFKNVFVDWGDGTLEPFAGKPLDTLYTNGTDFGSSYKVEPGAFKHTYSRSSTYRVKVFVLSDEDMVRDNIVGDVAQGLTPTQSFQGVFTRLSGAMRGAKTLTGPLASAQSARTLPTARAGKPVAASAAMAVPAFGTHAGEFLDTRPSAAQAMERAYVVYCHDLIIKDREDPCANLPVHLVSAELEFPKDESTPKLGKVQAMGGVPQTAQAAQKVQVGPAVASGAKSQTMASQSASAGSLPGLAAQAGSKPSLSSQAKVGGKPGLVNQSIGAQAANVSAAQTGPNLPSTTPCNLFYSALTRIKFYGQGTVRVVWKVDERQVGSREVVVKSPKRIGLKADEAQTCKNPLLGEVTLNSPALPVDSLGRHLTNVEAYVLPDKSGDLDLEDLNVISNLALGKALPSPMSPRLAHTLADTFGRAGSGKPPVKLGLLNPSQTPGRAAFVPLQLDQTEAGGSKIQRASNGVLSGLMQLQPPYRVETRGAYEVKATQPDKICNLFFPTKGGNFPVTNLGSTLKLTPDGAMQRASGKGLLVFGLKAGTAPDAVAPYPLSISFSDWQVDGVTVAKGQVELQPNQSYDGPGVTGKLLKVHGEIADKNAPQDMKATLELSPTDTSMVLTSDGSRRPVWKAEAPVTTQGDWIAKGLKLETTVLGPTPWAFSAEGVTIDLSSIEGNDPKGGKSPDWVGVSLGTVSLIPSTLGIQGGEWTKALPHPTDWTIEGLGVKGKADVGPWHSDYRNGHLSIGNIHFNAKNGHYAATYKDVEIRSPWFKDPIKGDATWVRMESGTYMLNLDKLHVDKRPTLAGGPMALEPMDLQFTRIKEGGLLMQGRAHISLRAENKPLATFDVERVGFGLDGLMYFGDEGERSAKATLNRASTLGFTPADLQDAVLSGATTKEQPLSLRINAKLRLSENPVIPGTPVTMNFALKAEGTPGSFTAPEVKVDPFSTEVAFPLGSPSLKAKINTNYQPGGAAGGAPAMPSNRFSGDVDLSMFGGAPVRAQFVLGYDKGKDYFATRVDVPLGPSGVVIYPEVVSLYRLSGGFAYNFGLDVFKDGGSIADAKPDFKGETLFMAGARLGSADGFIYTLDGQLAVKSSGAARMDFGAWLLSSNPSGNAPLRGCLEYSGGNFDGRIWGGMHFLGDTVALELGPSEQTAACSLHFGGGNWHIYAGDRNGQRIVGRLLGSTANAYMMLGNEVGLAVGGGTSWYLGAGVGVKAYAKGWMDMGLQITPQPKIIGDFGAGMEAGVCAFGACVSAGVNANIHAEALPIAVSASCCLDLPWPLGDICFTVKM